MSGRQMVHSLHALLGTQPLTQLVDQTQPEHITEKHEKPLLSLRSTEAIAFRSGGDDLY